MKHLSALLLCLMAWPAMAVDCTVGVYRGVPFTTQGPVQVPLTLLDTLHANFTSSSVVATSAASTAGVLPVSTSLLRIKCSAESHFRIGAAPTASSSDQIVRGNVVE